MGKAKYVCGQCARISGLPDFCCGSAMIQKGSYLCKGCGTSSGTAGVCCGQPMQQM